jgi:imidazole glycerol-phosphate synthase subunit HisH
MQTVAIIDYGSGNLHSAAKAFERAARESHVETRVVVTSTAADVIAADRIVLPGVGAFADCKRGLDAASGMREALDIAVLRNRRPFLGICVGMQLMADRGLEFYTTHGLGWIAGDVKEYVPREAKFKIPHMGWNTLEVSRPHALLQGIPTGPTGLHAYFVHSFHFVPRDEKQLVATTDHGGQITAMVATENLAGVQFHPEKSQALGLALITNFLGWKP